MIKIDKVSVMNWDNAIRGARNPMNSWDKSDSYYYETDNDYVADEYILGENDLSLVKRLSKAGSDHRKFLRQVFVSVDITAPLYWWKEFDTYKVGTVANSTSTMHKIHTKEFVIDDFSVEKCIATGTFKEVVDVLEHYRQLFNETKNKDYWYTMIQLLPSSYNQLRTVTLNYENIISMYFSRRHHKLNEWRVLCSEFEKLPYMKEILEAVESGRKTE